MKFSKIPLVAVLVVAGLFAGSTATFAQNGGGFGGGGRGRGGFAFTQDQTAQMRDAMSNAAEMTDLTNSLAIAQKAAIDAALASDATEASVRPKLKAVAAIETEIAVLHYNKAVKPMASSVTADQKTQIDAAAPAMTYSQLFGNAPVFGGRGGGRRGGGGGGGMAPPAIAPPQA